MESYVKGRHFKIKLVLLLLYLGVVGVTATWVIAGWPSGDDATLDADISAVPGALRGRTLILVSNLTQEDWHEVQLVLNAEYVHEVPVIRSGEQASVPVDEFHYVYTVPRNWSVGLWDGLAATPQPQVTGSLDITPTELTVLAREGQVTQTLDPPR